MNLYRVNWKIEGGGHYVPPDPGSLGGDYYADVTGADVITCGSAKAAKEAVQKARPRAHVYPPLRLGPAR